MITESYHFQKIAPWDIIVCIFHFIDVSMYMIEERVLIFKTVIFF